MKFLSMLGISGWKDLFGNDAPLGPITGGTYSWVYDLMQVMTTVLWVVLALVGAAGGIYAVYVGIKMARADSAEAREENKKRLINIVITIVVVIVLIIFFNVFLPMIIGAFTTSDNTIGKNPNDKTGTTGAVQAAVTAAKVFLRLPL